MSKHFLTDSEALIRFVHSNQQARDIHLQEAVIEALFRLGIHTSVPVKDRFAYLFQAYKRDSTNPKYAYHIGRLYFLHGELEKAGVWLRKAAHLNPTSHRIWTHIYLLHREMNLQYTGDTLYEPDALKKRSRRIAEKIKNGQDEFESSLLDFKPPRSLASIEAEKRKSREPAIRPMVTKPDAHPQRIEALPAVARITDKGICRWSGIHDLDLEVALEDNPSKNRLSVLYPLLRESLIQISKQRTNGLSAFGFLAIEWLIAGYPVRTIRRLLSEVNDHELSPTLDLLGIVCGLYEAEESSLPSLLAKHVENKSLPPLLAALIHRQRLLWRNQDFPQASSYAYARKILQENDSQTMELKLEKKDELDACRKDMEKFLRALRNPVPLKVLDDLTASSPQSLEITDALSITEITQQFGALGDKLSIQLEQDGERIRELFALNPSGPYKINEQVLGREVRLELLKTDNLVQLVLAEIDRIRESGKIKNDEELTQLDNLQNKFRSLRTGTLRKKLKALGLPEITKEEHSQAENVMLYNQPIALDPIGTPPNSPDEELFVLEQQADEITARLDEYWMVLTEILPANGNPSLGNQELAQVNEIQDYLRKVENLIQSSLNELDRLRESGLMTTDKQRKTRDSVQGKYQNIQIGKYKKKLKKLAFDNSPKLDGIEGGNSYSSTPGLVATMVSPSDPGSTSTLDEMLTMIDTEVDQMFTSVNDTFRFYSESILNNSPLQALYLDLRAQQAETYYRMGNLDKAQSVWRALALVDRLSAATLKNIAVVAMGNGEIGQTLSAWRAYCEVLYAHAVIANNPSFGAKERAEFHQNYASALLPPNFGKPLGSNWQEELDKQALFNFLQSPVRLRAFIDHILLYFLNSKLDFSSPTLILGVDRNESEATRVQARATLKALTLDVSDYLPERTGKAFAVVCNAYFDDALTASKMPESLTLKRDQSYASEKDRQLHWVTDLLKLLYKFFLVLVHDREVTTAVNSFECLEQLDRLTRLPVDLSPSFLGSAGQSLKIENVDEFLMFFKNIKQPIVASILSDLFAQSGEREDRVQQHQYRFLIEHWIRQSFLTEFVDIIDDPQPFYSPAIKETLKSGKSTPAVLDELRRWHERYPHLSGPARYLAVLLMRQEQTSEKKIEEIRMILNKAAEQGLTQKGRDDCSNLLSQIEVKHAIDTNDYEFAIKYARELFLSNLTSPEMLDQLFELYGQWINHSPTLGSSLVPQILKDFETWQKLVKSSLSEEIVEKNRNKMNEITAFAAIAKLQPPNTPNRIDLEQSIQVLSSLLDLDPENLHAIYAQMMTYWKIAHNISSSSREEACHYATKAEEAADRLLEKSESSKHQQDSKIIKERVKNLQC